MELCRTRGYGRPACVGQLGCGRRSRWRGRDRCGPRHRRGLSGEQALQPASPDLDPSHFVPGYDFVDDDDDPYDENGHGTHVASTIAEETDNGYGVTGLAYGVRIMPVRVLDRHGNGNPNTVAQVCGTRQSTGRR